MGVSVRDVALGVVLAAILLQGWRAYEEVNRRALVSRVTTRDATAGKSKLTDHSNVFNKKEVIQVTPNLHIAVGFALANVMMIEGQDGIIIVDVTESLTAAREVFAEFRKITKKPVKAIVYTHNHPDHVNGAEAFLESGQPRPEVWAHRDLVKLLHRQHLVSGAFYTRAVRQFGISIPAELINAGIGPRIRMNQKSDIGILDPTKTMSGIEKDLTIAGVNLKLVHIPGETEDQIGVWLPEDRAFLCADDVYEAFPNLYAIRGTPTRDTLHWFTSIDRMLSFKPVHLVPSHTQPVSGEDTVRELLTGYRDAIQFVHDQTIRYMNKGYVPDEIAHMIHLPEHLANHPYLHEFYGTVLWSVKGVFNSYMGWFSGDPVELTPLTPTEMAERTVQLAGGVDAVVTAAQEALGRGEWQWGLVLSSYVLRVSPQHSQAKEVRAKCLMELGERQISANGRNYYITTALEELGQISIKKAPKALINDYIKKMPLADMFLVLQVRWDAERCGVINSTVHFKFTDTKQDIVISTRNAIVLISDRPPSTPAKVTVTTTSEAWRDTVTNTMTGLANLATGAVKVDGGLQEFNKVMGCFEKD